MNRFRDLAEALPHMVWTCDPDGRCDYLSPQWVEYTGIAAEPQLGYGWLEQLHPEDVAPTQERWASAAASSLSFDTEFRIRRRDGAYRWFKTRARAVTDEAGKILKWYGSNTDIQELRDAQASTLRLNQELEAHVCERTASLGEANARLQAIATQLRIAQSVTQVGSWEFDLVENQVVWSDELFRILGMDPGEPVPQYEQQASLFTEESWARLSAAIARGVETGEGYDLELDVYRRDGALIRARALATTLRDANGSIAKLVGTFQDVTDRHQHARHLRELSSRLQLATSATQMGVWDWDVQTNVLIWDETMHHLYKTPEGGFDGVYEVWRHRLHPDDRERAERELAEAVAGGPPFDTSFRIVHPDGNVMYLRAQAVIHRDPSSGEVQRAVGVNWDVTEQRLAEQRVRRSEALQRAILASAGSAVVAMDLDGTITSFNRAAERLLGRRAGDVVGKLSLLALHDRAELRSRREQLERERGARFATDFEVLVTEAHREEAASQEWNFVRSDGSQVPVLVSLSLLREPQVDGSSGPPSGFLVVASDLRARREQDRALRELNQLLAERTAQAEGASQAKSRFLANMSHEIRTPLGAITGMGYLLARTQLSSQQRAYVDTIQSASGSLLGMINDVLDLSKVEAGQLELDLGALSTEQFVEDAATLMRGYAEGRPLELIVSVAPDVPARLWGDRVRLMQVVTNLTGNAVKFSTGGFVRLSVGWQERESEAGELCIRVDDTGCGIPPEQVERLFEPFTQGDAAVGSSVGTGLGLAIVRELVHLMGGSINVESALGVGSCFRVNVPLKALQPAAGDSRSADGRALEVLIAEDHDEQRLALAACAKKLGWNVTLAETGEQALEILLSGSRARPFHAVVLDWKMPGMGGLETLVAIRKKMGDQADCPGLVMLTALGVARLEQHPEARLADATLSKPVTAPRLYQTVLSALHDAAPTSEPLSSDLARLPGTHLLVVDDNEVNRQVAGRILELDGATVRSVESGRGALACVRENPRGFDAILMDLQMPEMDGAEATRAIRQLDQRVPILALTAAALSSERARALAAGMDDFVTKPFDPEDLVARVRAHVQRARPLQAQPREAPASAAVWPEVDGVVAADAARRLLGDVGLFRQLLGRLLEGFSDLQRVEPRSGVEGLPELAGRLHQLRGASGNLGARSLQEAAGDAESAARAQDAAQLRDGLVRVATELRRLQRGAAAVLPSWEGRAEGARAALPLDRELLSVFVQELRSQDLGALQTYERLDSQLASCLAEPERAALRSALEALDFARALCLVQTAAARADGPPAASPGAA